MPLSSEDKERFVAALAEDEQFLATVRGWILGKEMADLPARVAEMDLRLTERMDQLTQRMDQLAQRMDQLTEQIGQLREQIAQLLKVVSVHADDIGKLKGYDFERRVSQHPGGYLYPVLRKARLVPEGDLIDVLPEGSEEVLWADFVARGRLPADAQPTLAVVEVSWRVHSDDLARALARAKLLAAATGERVLPVAVTNEDPGPTIRERAGSLGVGLVWQNHTEPLAPGLPVQAA